MTKKKEKYYHIASLEKGMRVLELLAQKSALTVSDTARFNYSHKRGDYGGGFSRYQGAG